jgi:hypothetical protein
MAMLTTKQAATRMGLADSTLREWRMMNIGPAYVRFSVNSVRYHDVDIDKYVSERRYDPSVRAALEGSHAHR